MARTVSDIGDLCATLRDLAAPGDLIICLGAGDITKWAAALAEGICEARETKSKGADAAAGGEAGACR